jgi:hypothetical protein
MVGPFRSCRRAHYRVLRLADLVPELRQKRQVVGHHHARVLPIQLRPAELTQVRQRRGVRFVRAGRQAPDPFVLSQSGSDPDSGVPGGLG